MKLSIVSLIIVIDFACVYNDFITGRVDTKIARAAIQAGATKHNPREAA